MFDNRDNIDFGKTKIPQLFSKLFVPTLLGMLFNVAFMLTDGIFVGRGVGPEGIACVNLVAPIMMIVTGVGMMFGIGSTVVAAIHMAQDNEKAARINITQAYMACVIVALLLGTVFYCFHSPILHLLGVSISLLAEAREYYLWFIPTCLFLMFQLVGEFVIRLDGAPRYAMYANIIPALVNIILDYLFIFPCHMGLKGAALATDIGTAIGAGMTLYYMLFSAKSLSFYRIKHTTTSLRLTLRNIGYMTRMGLSALIGELAISVMILTGNHLFGHYLGDDGIAAYSVICYLFPVVYTIYCAVAQAAQPIISYNYGAHLTTRVNHTLRYSLRFSLLFGLAATLLFCLTPSMIISIFINPISGAFQLASRGLPLYSLGFVFMAFNMSAIGYFQSTEKAAAASTLMLLRGVIFLVAAFITLPLLAGTAGLWLAVPVAEALACTVGVLILLHTRAQTKAAAAQQKDTTDAL